MYSFIFRLFFLLVFLSWGEAGVLQQNQKTDLLTNKSKIITPWRCGLVKNNKLLSFAVRINEHNETFLPLLNRCYLDTAIDIILIHSGYAQLTDVVLEIVHRKPKTHTEIKHLSGHFVMQGISGYILIRNHKPLAHVYVQLFDKNQIEYRGYLLHALVTDGIVHMFNQKLFQGNNFINLMRGKNTQ